mmetsp:Transcript_28342/g.60081  ORF Transcript_28342/g.60081 Transcript_28342/m.60081 type:complete len:246 (-) Transcript_28342:509-1246(-)
MAAEVAQRLRDTVHAIVNYHAAGNIANATGTPAALPQLLGASEEALCLSMRRCALAGDTNALRAKLVQPRLHTSRRGVEGDEILLRLAHGARLRGIEALRLGDLSDRLHGLLISCLLLYHVKAACGVGAQILGARGLHELAQLSHALATDSEGCQALLQELHGQGKDLAQGLRQLLGEGPVCPDGLGVGVQCTDNSLRSWHRRHLQEISAALVVRTRLDDLGRGHIPGKARCQAPLRKPSQYPRS